MNKHNVTLEQRIIATLGNTNAGSQELAELIGEVEQAAATADQTITTERAKLLDLTQCRDPDEARERIAVLVTSRDRLTAARKPLADSLSAALAAEQKDRWWSEYRKVKTKLDAAVTAYKDYQQHADAIVSLFGLAAEVDREVSRLNETAPDGIDRRLRSVELTARGMGSFSRDQPSLSSQTILPRWDASARNLWPARPATSLAAEVAASMLAPPHPYPQGWGDPVERERRREAIERDQARSATFHESAARDEEDRKNTEAREQFAQAHRR
jgi:hypothetical protein